MYDLLNSGGVLFFNFEHIPIRRDIDEYLEPITVGDLPLDEGKFNLVCIQRLIDYKNRKAYVNFLEVRPQTNRRQILSGTEYRIFGCEDIKEAAEKSKFHKCNLIHTEDGVNWFCKMMKK